MVSVSYSVHAHGEMKGTRDRFQWQSGTIVDAGTCPDLRNSFQSHSVIPDNRHTVV